MKRIKLLLIVILLLLLTSCTNSGSIYESNKIRVTIIDSDFFTSSNKSELIERNSSFNTTLTMRDGYVVNYCSYAFYTLEKIEDNTYSLSVNNIVKPERIKLSCYREDGFNTYNETFETSIKYNYNDGTSRSETKNYELSYHIRQNTWNGLELKRDGYTLNGWNTKSDLTGEHIGLGSRVTVEKDTTLDLYAEWIKWTDISNLLYKKHNDDTASITGYKGEANVDYICFPEYIDGYKVTTITSSFTTNIPCEKIKSKTLIIPNTITTVEDFAFTNSSFEDIYFSDNIEKISYKSFGYNLKHYHINAYLNPRLQKDNYNVRFADNIDILIKYQNEKKIVLFGGCNLAYGLYTPMIEKEFSNYKVVNCGLNGEFNALFQMEIIETYLNQNDIFIHAPEQMNEFQFLKRLLIDSRMFMMVEGNYDLFSLADFSYSPFIFEGFFDYIEFRSKNEECLYSDNPNMFNTYGDFLDDRQYYEPTELSRDVMYTENCKYELSVLGKDNIFLLGNKYNDIARKGVKVYFTQSPLNENSCEHDVIYDKANEFQKALEEALKGYNVEIISKASDYIFKGRYFFDTDYHLNFYGAELRTENLINDLKKAGVK